jgi:hypothetical protein
MTTVNTAQNTEVAATLHFLKALSIFPPYSFQNKKPDPKKSGKDQVQQSFLPSEGR